MEPIVTESDGLTVGGCVSWLVENRNNYSETTLTLALAAWIDALIEQAAR